MRPALPLSALLLPVLLLLAACGDCDCCKKKPEATPVAAAPAAEPSDAPRTPPTVATAWRGEGATLELSVWEMHCGGCELKVEKALAALEGVASVKADAQESRVVVTLAKPEAREALKPLIRSALAAEEFRILGE